MVRRVTAKFGAMGRHLKRWQWWLLVVLWASLQAASLQAASQRVFSITPTHFLIEQPMFHFHINLVLGLVQMSS
jgi:hypothetical protein